MAGIFLAILSGLSTILIYKLSKELFDQNIALIAALFYSVSSLGIRYAQIMFNPTPLLFLSSLMFYLSLKAVKQKQSFLLLPIALLAGLILQTELANAFFLDLALLIFLALNFKIFKKKT